MGALKRNEVLLEPLFDYSFNGIVRMDSEGRITDVNPVMEDILEIGKNQVEKRMAGEVFLDMDRESLRQVLEEGKDSYSFSMQINKVSLFAVLAPIVIDGKAEGAI